jgi:GT2 family glycosyltransferase
MNIPTEAMNLNEAYVLITAAYNEELYVEKTIRSVLSQSVRPLKWIIVSDASTDRTDEIVKKYAGEGAFIELLRLDAGHHHSFAAKAHAIIAGYDCLKGLEYGFIGILDADVSFEPSYFNELVCQLIKEPKLGLTGGFIYEQKDGVFICRPGNRSFSVAGAVQLFRRECYEEIGGIRPLRYSGEDWCAEVKARMMGWTVRANPELKVFHHRATGTTDNLLRYRFQQGHTDFSLGCLPAFELVKCIGRLAEKPFALGALARLAGFAWPYCTRASRSVSEEFVQFIQAEQRERLFSIFKRTHEIDEMQHTPVERPKNQSS